MSHCAARLLACFSFSGLVSPLCLSVYLPDMSRSAGSVRYDASARYVRMPRLGMLRCVGSVCYDALAGSVFPTPRVTADVGGWPRANRACGLAWAGYVGETGP